MFFVGKYTVRNYRTEQSIARDKANMSGNQADQAYRVQMEHLLRLPYL